VIVQIGVQVRPAIFVRRQEPSVHVQSAAQEVHRAERGIHPFGAAKDATGVRHAADHERIPGSQNFFVSARAHPLLARIEQLAACTREKLLRLRQRNTQLCRDLIQRLCHEKMPAHIFEIGRLVQSEMPIRDRQLVCGQQRRYFLARPHIELPFLVLRIGIQRRVVTALGRLHLPHQPLRGFLAHACEERVAGDEPGVCVQEQQRTIVVEHLLEMRNVPALIYAIPAKTAAELIVDAALGHLPERMQRDMSCLRVVARCPAA